MGMDSGGYTVVKNNSVRSFSSSSISGLACSKIDYVFMRNASSDWNLGIAAYKTRYGDQSEDHLSKVGFISVDILWTRPDPGINVSN
ncbi:hypothetical protein H5410_009827 [Solanum commersonii]|uniref:Uncharacterized protein n=1 Tax=Solanum commersonii TaxID=4109 RepID=A0A9J6AJI6_SOLCO|nr:hypothetical protein H5410_009827 [Solanum commersonii]